jgi:Transposase
MCLLPAGQTLRRGPETVLADRLDLCFLLFDAGCQCANQSSQALDAIFQMLLLPERKDGWPPDPRKFRKAVYWYVHCGIDHNWSLLLRPEIISECDQSGTSLGRFSRSDKIGVDEIQYAKGHKYLTLVYQIDLDVTRLLWIGKERTIESFQGFFTVIGDEIASKIVFVCSDMWEPYLNVIREKCSEALHILDRFHIVAKMNKALDEVRAGESRRMLPC